MIRTGYLRWEIEVQDERSSVDIQAREVVFLARPTHRYVRVKTARHAEATQRFAQGDATYDSVLRTLLRGERRRTDHPRRRPPALPLFGNRPRVHDPLLDGETPARRRRLCRRGGARGLVVPPACDFQSRTSRGTPGSSRPRSSG